MRAARLVGRRRFEVVQVDEPRPRPDQALVAVDYVAVCGTDLHLCSMGRTPEEYASLPVGYSGHECVGRVLECPDGSLNRGQPVLVIGDDTFAEYLAIEPEYLLPLPLSLPLREMVLAQLLGTVLYACKRFGSVLGQDVVVLGQGPAGLLFTAVLARLGARRIICTDIVPARLEASIEMGASRTINAASEDVAAVVSSVTGGKLADLVIEASGETVVRNQALDLVRFRGIVHCFGLPAQDCLPFDFGMFFKRQAMLMCTGKTAAEPGLHSFRSAVDWLADGRISVSRLVTHCLALEDINQAFELAFSRSDGALKVLISLGRP